MHCCVLVQACRTSLGPDLAELLLEELNEEATVSGGAEAERRILENELMLTPAAARAAIAGPPPHAIK